MVAEEVGEVLLLLLQQQRAHESCSWHVRIMVNILMLMTGVVMLALKVDCPLKLV